jgi:hypothetical protein
LPPTTLHEANRAEGNVDGALRRSSAEPQAPQITKNQAIKGAAWVGVLGAGFSRAYSNLHIRPSQDGEDEYTNIDFF